MLEAPSTPCHAMARCGVGSSASQNPALHAADSMHKFRVATTLHMPSIVRPAIQPCSHAAMHTMRDVCPQASCMACLQQTPATDSCN